MLNLGGIIQAIRQHEMGPENLSSLQRRRWCSEPGCERTTKEGKPYCRDHVANHPYVVDLLARIENGDEKNDIVRDLSTLPSYFDWLRDGKPTPPSEVLRKRNRKVERKARVEREAARASEAA